MADIKEARFDVFDDQCKTCAYLFCPANNDGFPDIHGCDECPMFHRSSGDSRPHCVCTRPPLKSELAKHCCKYYVDEDATVIYRKENER